MRFEMEIICYTMTMKEIYRPSSWFQLPFATEVFENYIFQLRPRLVIVGHHGDFEYLVKILENYGYQILNTDLPNEELIAINKEFY